MKRGNIIFLLIMTLATLPRQKAQAQKMDLKGCLEYALKNSRSLKKAKLDFDKNEGKLKEVLASGLPQINIEGDYKQHLKLPTTILPGALTGNPDADDISVQMGKEYNATATAKATQLLYSQSFLYAVKAAKESRELYALMLDRAEEDIIFDISTQFLKIGQLTEQKEFVDQSLKTLNESRRSTALRYEQGFAKSTDVKRIDVNLGRTVAKGKDLEREISRMHNLVKFMIGMPIDADLTLDFSATKDAPLLVSDAQLPAFSGFTNIKTLRTQENLYGIKIKEINSGYMPTLSAYASAGWQAQRDEFNFTSGSEPWFGMATVGLSLKIPVFDGFEKKARVTQAKLERDEVSLDILDAQENIRLEHKNALDGLSIAKDQKANAYANMNLAEEVYGQTRIEYRQGLTPLTELLQTETDWREASMEFAKQNFQTRIAELQLIKAQGRLKELSGK
ncbi:transporter (plasmid) [Fulvitalea axinellae]|uniref:Transporter n=1 Tax=Fulvitalea axinellae TaxID=1182444 RepID=A0AAU9CZK7_9BACT|nr:transporter [Fulvitalea axinellae]